MGSFAPGAGSVDATSGGGDTVVSALQSRAFRSSSDAASNTSRGSGGVQSRHGGPSMVLGLGAAGSGSSSRTPPGAIVGVGGVATMQAMGGLPAVCEVGGGDAGMAGPASNGSPNASGGPLPMQQRSRMSGPLTFTSIPLASTGAAGAAGGAARAPIVAAGGAGPGRTLSPVGGAAYGTSPYVGAPAQASGRSSSMSAFTASGGASSDDGRAGPAAAVLIGHAALSPSSPHSRGLAALTHRSDASGSAAGGGGPLLRSPPSGSAGVGAAPGGFGLHLAVTGTGIRPASQLGGALGTSPSTPALPAAGGAVSAGSSHLSRLGAGLLGSGAGSPSGFPAFNSVGGSSGASDTGSTGQGRRG
jgi:hypothetical protein